MLEVFALVIWQGNIAQCLQRYDQTVRSLDREC
jgi:hypothetical protein